MYKNARIARMARKLLRQSELDESLGRLCLARKSHPRLSQAAQMALWLKMQAADYTSIRTK
jgi:hypothetical protein